MQMRYVTELLEKAINTKHSSTMSPTVLTEVLHVPPLKCKLDLDL